MINRKLRLIKYSLILVCAFLLVGCQLGYLITSGYDHLAMLSSRIPIDEALVSNKLTPEQKSKILLSQEAKIFSFAQLGLKKSGSYSHYVQLNRPYITYLVMAAEKWQLKPYIWYFPILGDAPYKGFYDEISAKKEAESLKEKGFDVYVRGVSAYSTLGKLNDPLLSSMLSYKEHDLVNTVIHELVHSTLFIKNNIDFNERLAMFVAAKGTEIFYRQREGANSKTLQLIQNENEDDRLFSEFISAELNQLTQWYTGFKKEPGLSASEHEQQRQQRLNEIRESFSTNLKSKLKTNSYFRFTEGELNNARLSNYHTYLKDLADFESVFKKTGNDITAFLKKCEALNAVENPDQELKKWASE